MLRVLFFFILSAMSTLAFAADSGNTLPTLFQPTKEDVSVYYLGALFGNQLVPGGGDMHLLSYVFEVFNQIALAVGLTIVTYVLITGVLNTAAQGKPLGEKMNAVWMPIRMVVGISLLIPKAGTGYCLAQASVMWLILQGVGAADAVWSRALDYFQDGGAIYADEKSEYTKENYMNEQNMRYAYSSEEQVLRNTTCMAAHNASDAAGISGKYTVYSSGAGDNYKYVNYGNENAWEDKTGGQECGYIEIKVADKDPEGNPIDEQQQSLIARTYTNGFLDMSNSLQKISEFLASDEGDDVTQWEPDHFPEARAIGAVFVNYLMGANNILNPNQQNVGNGRDKKLDELRKYGWILAGHYYMTLTSFNDNLQTITVNFPDRHIENPESGTGQEYETAITNAKNFWGCETAAGNNCAKDHPYSFMQWGERYAVPGYEQLDPGVADEQDNYRLTKKEVEQIATNIQNLADTKGSFTLQPVWYMAQITGFGSTEGYGGGSGFSQDPIYKAASFGGKLTETAVAMVMVTLALYLGLAIIGALSAGSCYVNPFGTATMFGLLITIIFSAPIIFGIAAFLYGQGVMLGVALPLIPYTIFLVGSIGWFMAVIESIVAAPLIAIGLIFPEANQDIMGKAEPAIMMILNLMLRPSLMVIGFVAAMILTWIAVDLLNAAFYLFLKDGANIETTLFGYIVLTMAYIALLLTVVAKIYDLITELPNRTLAWIGDRTQGQAGAGEMISQMKGGVERGGGAAGGAMSTAGSLSGKAAEMGLKSKDAGGKGYKAE